jgi:cytidyltransferase-like protein
VAKKPRVGVYWGRFNPPHKGHLAMVRRFRKACALTVAIGSSERRGRRNDPFSGQERKVMMEAYLREAGIRDVRVVALRDGPSVRWAIDNLIRRCRPDVVFLSTERDRLARAVARRVRVVRFRRTGRISSTRLRADIASGNGGWRRLTGVAVVRWILTHHGIARIRRSHRLENGSRAGPPRVRSRKPLDKSSPSRLPVK